MTERKICFVLQTVWNDGGGGGNWPGSRFPTVDDAVAHVQRYIRNNRRILIWQINNSGFLNEQTMDLVGYMKDKHSDVVEVKS